VKKKTTNNSNGKGQMANGLGFEKSANRKLFEFCHLPFAL
jgi:hypothetical protein